MPYELAASRHVHNDPNTYDWHLGVGLDRAATHRLILQHHQRCHWPQLVREYGVTSLASVTFRGPEERMLFAMDCDL